MPLNVRFKSEKHTPRAVCLCFWHHDTAVRGGERGLVPRYFDPDKKSSRYVRVAHGIDADSATLGIYSYMVGSCSTSYIRIIYRNLVLVTWYTNLVPEASAVHNPTRRLSLDPHSSSIRASRGLPSVLQLPANTEMRMICMM